MQPSLAEPTELYPMLQGPMAHHYAAQQKLDGHRLLVHINEGKVAAYNRMGKPRNLPRVLEQSLRSIKGEWQFDGELVGKHYWIFDVIKTPRGSAMFAPWLKRQALLTAIFAKHNIPLCSLVPYALELEDKCDLIQNLREHRAEGVVFKHIDKSYLPGRHKNFLKYKFTKTVDCVVIGKGVDGKDNFELGLLDPDKKELVNVGKVSAVTGDGKNIKVGDVVEVTSLYVTESGKLYQPVSPKIRLDKAIHECVISQLEELKTNKSVLTTIEKSK